MRIFDLTLPISPSLPVWPGDPAPVLESRASMAAGDPYGTSVIHMGSHTGTHVDAPRHFMGEGTPVDRLPLEALVGEVWLAEIPPAVSAITPEALLAAGIPEGTHRLLLKTSNSQLWDRTPWAFTPDYVSLTESGAEWIAAQGIQLLGVDYLSIDPADSKDFPAHRVLLGHGVVVVEGLDLRAVAPGRYQLCCLPMKVAGGDGAPARVLLVSQGS